MKKNMPIEQVQIVKCNENKMQVFFNIENPDINLVEMIHFGLIDLLFKINMDVCDSYSLHSVAEDGSTGKLKLILKHILKDLGVPQMWVNAVISRENKHNSITLTIVKDYLCAAEPYEQMPLEKIIINCDTTNRHKIDICIEVYFDEEYAEDTFAGTKPNKNMSNFIDKMLKTLVKNIINRLKQFIEKMPYTNNITTDAKDDSLS